MILVVLLQRRHDLVGGLYEVLGHRASLGLSSRGVDCVSPLVARSLLYMSET